jgi:hypothetical protein
MPNGMPLDDGSGLTRDASYIQYPDHGRHGKQSERDPQVPEIAPSRSTTFVEQQSEGRSSKNVPPQCWDANLEHQAAAI